MPALFQERRTKNALQVQRSDEEHGEHTRYRQRLNDVCSDEVVLSENPKGIRGLLVVA